MDNQLLCGRRVQARKRSVSKFSLFAGLFLGLTCSQISFATQVKVRVLDPDLGKPVSNAAVCLGTPAQPDQFGAQRTDHRGLVSFQVATVIPALITVSANQHKGVQRAVSIGKTDILREISLPRGGLGPDCQAGPTRVAIKAAGQETPKLRLAGLQIDRGEQVTRSRSVVLTPSIRGTATEYRVSENRNFKDAEWQSFQSAPLYMLSAGNGRKQLYYQVREVLKVEKGQIERVSNVVSDSITLKSR